MPSDSRSDGNATTDSRGRPMSHAVATELQTANSRIGAPVVALRVWERLFAEEERRQLGGDIEVCWRQFGTSGMWMEAYDVSREQAVIDVAEGLNLMDAGTARWLRRELELENSAAVPTDDQPSWNLETGKFQMGNRVIRCFRVLRNPSNIQQILDEFQLAEWANRIDNPLSLGQQQLHETLRYLNSVLSEIRFRAQEGGEAIVWERV